MRLTLIRHGESIDNINNVCQGQTHGELSARGILQAQAVATFLEDIKYDICYSSDLRRASQTADIITSKQNIPVTTDIRLRERFFGERQGLVMTDDWDGLAEYQGVESISDINLRIENFLAEIIKSHIGKEVLVVSHGITLRLLVTACLSNKTCLELAKNCSVSTLELNKSMSFDLIEYNSVSHLKTIL